MRILRLKIVRQIVRLKNLRPRNLHILYGSGLRTDVKLLFQSALALLAIAVVTGTLDGQNQPVQPVQPVISPKQDPAHLQSGTLGWLLLSVVALSLILFGSGMLSVLERRVANVASVLSAGSVVSYVLVAFSSIALARVVCAAAVLLSVVSLLGWLGMRGTQIRLGLPHVALLLSMPALIFAATISVLLEMQSITSTTFFAEDTASAQPVAFTAGFLLLAAMAVVEWRLPPLAGTPLWLGAAQITLAFVAAMTLGGGLLLNIAAAVPFALVLELASGVLFVVRFAPRLRTVRWLDRGSERYFALACIFLAAYLGFFVYLLGKLTFRAYPGFDEIPPSLTSAIDHLMFLGVMTNTLFGLLFETTRERRSFWPATEDLLFWGMNLGLLGFVVGLVVTNSMAGRTMQGIFTPILGACLLVGVVACSVRLQTARVRIEMVEPGRAVG